MTTVNKQHQVPRALQEQREKTRQRIITVLTTVAALLLPTLGLVTLVVGGMAYFADHDNVEKAQQALAAEQEARSEAEASLEQALADLTKEAFGITAEDLQDLAEESANVIGAGAWEIVTATRSPDGHWAIVTQWQDRTDAGSFTQGVDGVEEMSPVLDASGEQGQSNGESADTTSAEQDTP